MLGRDYLGGAKYPDLILREHPKGWAAGFFAETFGNALPIIEKLANTGRCPLIRVQLLWSDTHTFTHSDTMRAVEIAKKIEVIARKNKRVKFELSPFCEHNLKNPDQALEAIKMVAPSCTPVNCPWQGALSSRFKNEVHGYHAKPRGRYNYSTDGDSCVDINITKMKRLHKDADVFFFWHPADNGKLNTSDPTPRPERKAWPTEALQDSIIYLKNKRGKTSLPEKFIYKSHADRHETPPEPRAYKPVLIAPVKAARFELVAKNGQVVGVLPYYGTFDGGGYRYYLGEYGYQVAEKAIRIQGSPVVELRANGKVYGKINPAFRDGSFR